MSNAPERTDRRAERGQATRAKLIRAARELFAERGFDGVGTNDVVDRAGVTRGAMYHHFRSKRDLFGAVYEAGEKEIVERAAATMSEVDDPWELLVAGVRSFFDAATDPALMRIGLVDGPSVLGWREWREVGTRYGLGLVTAGLQNAVDAGVLRNVDTTQLAHLMMGAFGEGAMLIAAADDPAAARERIEATLIALLEGLRA